MRPALVIAVVVGSGAATTSAARAQKPTQAEIKEAAKRLAEQKRADDAKLNEVLAKADADGFTALAGTAIELRGLWFPSEKCRASFGGRKTVMEPEARALASCLFELKLTNVVNKGFVHEPGVTVHASMVRGKLVRLSSIEVDPSSPTVDGEVLEKHARRALAVKRDPKTAAIMKQDPDEYIAVAVRACIDPKGKVDALSVTSETTASGSYRTAVEKAAKGWTFKPFKHLGKPIRVCAYYYLDHYDGDGILGGIMGGGEEPAPTPPPPVKR